MFTSESVCESVQREGADKCTFLYTLCSVLIHIQKDTVETKEQKENKAFSSSFPQFHTFMGGKSNNKSKYGL